MQKLRHVVRLDLLLRIVVADEERNLSRDAAPQQELFGREKRVHLLEMSLDTIHDYLPPMNIGKNAKSRLGMKLARSLSITTGIMFCSPSKKPASVIILKIICLILAKV